jgi:hypothetical protein
MSGEADVNPYEPSHCRTQRTLNIERGARGPWRDGQFLVVDVDVYDVDISRCVITGADVESNERRVLDVHGPQILFGDSIYPLRWPMSRRVRTPRGMVDIAGWLSLFGGVVALSLEYYKVSSWWGAYIAAVALPAGMFLLLFIDRKFIQLHHRDGNFAWISGVHPRCLEGLPDVSVRSLP